MDRVAVMHELTTKAVGLVGAIGGMEALIEDAQRKGAGLQETTWDRVVVWLKERQQLALDNSNKALGFE